MNKDDLEKKLVLEVIRIRKRENNHENKEYDSLINSNTCLYGLWR